jgi:hypothetical protein
MNSIKMTKEWTAIVDIVAIITLLVLSALFPVQANSSIPTSSAQSHQSNNFSFGTAGDWSTNSDTNAIASNMVSHQIQIIIGLGDYCYCGSPSNWWNGLLSPINNIIFRGAQGNHDADSGGLQYLQLFGQSSWTSSFNYKNMHFAPIDRV